MLTYLLALVLGICFGFALQKGGLTRYTNISGVYRFTNLTVIKFMLTAIAVAMVGLWSLKGAGLIQLPTVPPTYIVGNLVGGLIFGVGMSLAGFCPGTIAAGAGEGKLDYLIPGGLGLLAGSLIYGLVYPQVFPPLANLAYFGNITLPQVMGVDPGLLVAVFVVFILLLFYFLERGLKRKDRLDE